MEKINKRTIIIGGTICGIGYIFFWWWFFHAKNVAITAFQEKRMEQKVQDTNQKEESQATENDVEDINEVEMLGDFRMLINTGHVQVDAPLVEGVTDNDLAHGVGHHRTTVLPGGKGNIVLSGHRWKYGDNPNYTVFENLDALQNGDEIILRDQNREYRYIVYEHQIVDDDAVEILNQTEESVLTVYTCTPKYTALKRLVYRARLVQ